MGLKVALVMLHLIYVGILFLFDGGLIEKTKREPWYANASIQLFILYLSCISFCGEKPNTHFIDRLSSFMRMGTLGLLTG